MAHQARIQPAYEVQVRRSRHRDSLPHTTVFYGEDRDGKAPSAKLQIEG
jgi:hypothetical protein